MTNLHQKVVFYALNPFKGVIISLLYYLIKKIDFAHARFEVSTFANKDVVLQNRSNHKGQTL